MKDDERDPRDAAASLPASRSFVVQFAPDTPPPGNKGFRGRVEHIESGRSRRFASTDELLAFVRAVLDTSDRSESDDV